MLFMIDILYLAATAAHISKRGTNAKRSKAALTDCCTVLVLRMVHRKWKEGKQQPRMLPSFSWLLLSLSPYPVGHPEHEHCTLFGIKLSLAASTDDICENEKPLVMLKWVLTR